ncbi:MAG: UTP--glucose-1-phosphate uridylyltransferase [Deltaproteobacteria bacterium RIFCSPHIGHO2_02_FULL_40_11]|nr:MAG: UTP--glucose-1-phosphate uridylyltransferase [Deltaproteobacteria bacterium RIFCSPHIGHO2_02_FULL_40_11]
MTHNQKVRKAVVPVAGLGTRFLPVTKTIPKEMLPIVDKPSIQYIVEEAVCSGIEQIIFVNSSGKEAIEDHFDTNLQLDAILQKKKDPRLIEEMKKLSQMVQITTVRQKEPLGLGHAIYCAKNLIGNEPFAVLLGDDLVDAKVPCIQQLMQAHQAQNANVVALMEVPKDQTYLYGIADASAQKENPRAYDVRHFFEKPKIEDAPSNLAIIGRYVLSPKIFEILETTRPGKNGEIQLTDALNTLTSHEKVIGLQYEGLRFDAGDKIGFLEANLYFALKRPEFKDRLSKILRRLEL